MLLEDLDSIVKPLRRSPLFKNNASGEAFSLNREAIFDLIPHRDPFLMIDSIDGLDKESRTIRGSKLIAADDPVFAGHFPGNPVYPGVLQVEAMGQLALCLARLTAEEDDETLPNIRAIKIHHAIFMAPVLPGDQLSVHAKIIEDTGLTAISAGQLYKGSTLCSCSVQEVCFVD